MSDLEMSCRELVEVVTDYLEGHMAPGDRRRFEEHLGECPHCVLYVEQMRETIAALGRLGPEALDPEVQEGLVHAFRRWRR